VTEILEVIWADVQLEAIPQKLGRPPVMHEVTLISRIPNQKADINNQGAFSTDYIGKSWFYPDDDYATRAFGRTMSTM
jgi:hypothetical protein